MPPFSPPRFKEGLRLEGWTLVDGGRFTDLVWRARHDNGRYGVIKTARGKKPPWPKRFAHEVATLEELQPSHGVLRLLDRDATSTPRWMVTELAESLANHLGPAPDLGTVGSAFADIADTLVDAQLNGISHRDIKPDNLFYARGRSVVGDFGLATGHDSPGLTGHGDRVGPANFCAPEALSAHDDIEWSAADVYALAKSFWAILAEERYPPQGPLYVRRPECDLGRFGGRAAEDLARLLEMATEDKPSYRPSLPEFHGELRTWLQIYPAGSTPRRVGYPSLFDEATSAAKVDEGGPSKIVDTAVHRLLDDCRKAGPDNGRIVDDPKADIIPWDDPRAEGDPDWTPDHLAVKRLSWNSAGGIRLVAVGVLEGDGDLRYGLSWQRRVPRTGSWEVAWQTEGRVRARLPSDHAERIRLTGEAMRQRPTALSDPPSIASSDTEETLRRVATSIRRREITRERELDDTKRRVKSREEAARKAREDFNTFWAELTDFMNSAVEHDIDIRNHHRDDDWILTVGDRRIVVWAGEGPAHIGPALLLGTVTVEAEEGDGRYKSEVANLCAIADSSGDPIWQLLRFQRNDMAKPPVRIAEALFDGCGAINHNLLDELLHADFRGEHVPRASLVSRDPLTVDTLMRVVAAELDAIDQWADPISGPP